MYCQTYSISFLAREQKVVSVLNNLTLMTITGSSSLNWFRIKNIYFSRTTLAVRQHLFFCWGLKIALSEQLIFYIIIYHARVKSPLNILLHVGLITYNSPGEHSSSSSSFLCKHIQPANNPTM